MSTDTPPDKAVTGATIESSRGGPAPQIDLPWKPTYLFVYGSLMDADVLQHVLGLPHTPPPLQPAKLENYKMKMWGIYPTLVPNTSNSNGNSASNERDESAGVDDAILGALYLVEHPAQFTLLERYETKAYTWHRCVAEFTDVTGSNYTTEQSGFECRTFVWAGAPDSPELFDGGTFDLERYRKYYKPKFLRKGLP